MGRPLACGQDVTNQTAGNRRSLGSMKSQETTAIAAPLASRIGEQSFLLRFAIVALPGGTGHMLGGCLQFARPRTLRRAAQHGASSQFLHCRHGGAAQLRRKHSSWHLHLVAMMPMTAHRLRWLVPPSSGPSICVRSHIIARSCPSRASLLKQPTSPTK